MTTAKWTINTGAQEDLGYPAARLNEKGCLPVWGWRCSNKRGFETPAVLGTAKSIRNSQIWGSGFGVC